MTSAALNLEASFSSTDRVANKNDPTCIIERLRSEIAETEPVIGAAILVNTAFKMRDEHGLIATLRSLAEAVSGFEARRADA